jgi:ABC-type phosphonate transport system ATPase subunit
LEWFDIGRNHILRSMEGLMDQAIIETDHLAVYYGRQRGVHNLDMTVLPGEIYGFWVQMALGRPPLSGC